MPDTITVTTKAPSATFHATLTPAQRAGVFAALASVVTIDGLPAGKTLNDSTSLVITLIVGGPNANGAAVSGTIPTA